MAYTHAMYMASSNFIYTHIAAMFDFFSYNAPHTEFWSKFWAAGLYNATNARYVNFVAKAFKIPGLQLRRSEITIDTIC